jgi:hypothetical protein
MDRILEMLLTEKISFPWHIERALWELDPMTWGREKKNRKEKHSVTFVKAREDRAPGQLMDADVTNRVSRPFLPDLTASPSFQSRMLCVIA